MSHLNLQDLEDFENLGTLQNEISEFSPKDIVLNVFTKPAGEPYSQRMLFINEENHDVLDITYLYEILISILLESLECAVNSLKKYDFVTFSKDNLDYFLPWFRSLGFNMFVSECDIKDRDLYNNYFCKILINNSLVGEDSFFDINNLNNSYYFLLNGYFDKKDKKLKDIMSIFRFNNKIFMIHFDYFK
jgi:hypothetical protein